MILNQVLQSFSGQPITHQIMMDVLKDYKRPNDKVHALISEGVLRSVKKGLYIAGKASNFNAPEPFLLANHILGPSYVSLDSALSYYGLIPERVYEVTSVTTKATRKFNTRIGVYSYTYLPSPYYSFGLLQTMVGEGQFAMIASPEKALIDKVVSTAGIIFRSQKDVLEYLTENLRIDEDDLKGIDTKTLLSWVPDAPKKDSLSMLVKTLKRL